MEDKKVKDVKKSNKRFIIVFIIFVIILASATGVAIYFSIEHMRENQVTEEVVEEKTEEIKRVAEDSKYGIQSYTETYDTNSIDITSYHDVGGRIVLEDYEYYNGEGHAQDIHFVQIKGLKDKNIQTRINERLKQSAYSFNTKYASTTVTASFSNILSLYIYGYGDNVGPENAVVALNIDLTTGQDIPLEKVFVSSAPLNSFLVEGLYEALAWREAWREEGGGIGDMNTVDTSNYEDKSLIFLKQYSNKKDNLQYSIYSNRVTIWNIVDKNLVDSDYNSSLDIDFLKHKEDVAIYRRYLSSSSIFENSNLGMKDVIVMTGLAENDYMINLSYGKVSDNIFVEEVLYDNFHENWKTDTVKEFLKPLLEEKKRELKRTFKDKGVFFQREFYMWESQDGSYYGINAHSVQTTCKLSYFEEEAFKDYVKAKNAPMVEATLNAFSPYVSEDYPNLTISDEDVEYYISPSGEFLGNSEEEARSKLMEDFGVINRESDLYFIND